MSTRKYLLVIGTILIGLLGAVAALTRTAGPAEAAGPVVTVYKNPNCGCCNQWVDHLRENGFQVEARNATDLARIKAERGVPAPLAACHTAVVDGYVIEGHVPADVIRRLLAERPEAAGLAVPGMPVGSPGMEVPGSFRPAEPYDVLLFQRGGGATVYATR
jgi:hypothetical protein